jgi:hypothetical protein
LFESCEVWGYENTKQLGKLHLQFCRNILGVRTTTPNFMTYGELDRTPIDILCIKSIGSLMVLHLNFVIMLLSCGNNFNKYFSKLNSFLNLPYNSPLEEFSIWLIK